MTGGIERPSVRGRRPPFPPLGVPHPQLPYPRVLHGRFPGELLWLRMRDPLALLSRMAAHGDVTQLRAGRSRLVLLSHPEDVARFVAAGSRRAVEAAQAVDGLARAAAVGVRRARRLAASWRDAEVLDIHAAMRRLALGVAWKTVCDLDIGSDLDIVGEASAHGWGDQGLALHPLARLHLARTWWRHRRRRALLTLMILDRGTEHARREDLLSTLLATHARAGALGGAPHDELSDVLGAVLASRHEPLAATLTWACALVASHPLVESAMHAELAAVLGDRSPRLADVPHLRFTRRVLAETLRLYPPVWLIARRTGFDVDIRGRRIPAGATLCASPFVIHRDRRWYDDPAHFDPARWSRRATHQGAGAYCPFGDSLREAPGEAYVWTMGVLILATIAQRWQLQALPASRTGIAARGALHPARGLPMQVLARRAIRIASR